MYTPPHFKEDRIEVLQGLIDQSRLTTLVTMGGNGLLASHVPVIIEPDQGPFGTLHGHLSRANLQGRDSDPSVPALAIFTGPDAYITPSWYPTKQQTGKVVPTWNYVAVHAYGDLEFFDDPGRLLPLVNQLTDKHEAGRVEPWAVSDAPADFIEAQLKGIIGFRLPISRLEGKSKMSQNRSAEDQAGVIDGLNEDGGLPEVAVADIMTGKS